MDEALLREEIKELISVMSPGSYVEITHGQTEYGKDLVVIQKGEFGDLATAVVVVRGDIRTRSSGLIDKIKSQVEQCFKHPVFIKPVKGPVNISHVWVMIAGALSEGANTRLYKEIDRPNIQIFDLKWLSDNFTKHYPYVFFEGTVSKYLENKINELESQHLLFDRKIGTAKNISDYYVPPSVATVDSVLELSEDNMTFLLLSDIERLDQMRKNIVPPRKFFIVGDPGVGKSTALVKIAIDMLTECFGEAKALCAKRQQILHIPIVLKAKDIMDIGNAEQLLARHGPGEEIRDRFSVKALLVDALDEVPGEHRRNVIKQSIKYADEMSAALVICSRRIDAVTEDTLKLERRELLPFEFNQAMDLFRRLVSDNKMLASLKDGLERVQGQLPFTPISLLFMVELVENNKEVPASIVELYDRFTDIALGSEDRMRKGIQVLFDYQIKRRFLEELAYAEFFKKNTDLIDRSEFDAFLDDYAKRFGWKPEQLRDFILEIERAGLLSMRDKVHFVHASFLDYFAACRIADIREEIPELNNYIAKTYFDDWWSDVAFYYAGIRRHVPEQLLNKVFEFEERGDNIRVNVAKMLVGKILQAAWHSEKEVKVYGIEQSLELREKVRDQAREFMEKRHGRVPAIYADWYTMAISRISFGSRFMWPAVCLLIDKYLEDNTQRSIANAIHLVWAMKDKLPEEELREVVGRLLDGAAKAPRDSVENTTQYTKNLLMLNITVVDDPAVSKSIMKRLRHEYKLNSVLFGKLLPPARKGFRSAEARHKAPQRKLLKRKEKTKS